MRMITRAVVALSFILMAGATATTIPRKESTSKDPRSMSESAALRTGSATIQGITTITTGDPPCTPADATTALRMSTSVVLTASVAAIGARLGCWPGRDFSGLMRVCYAPSVISRGDWLGRARAIHGVARTGPRSREARA
jgi:hypothetical protein